MLSVCTCSEQLCCIGRTKKLLRQYLDGRQKKDETRRNDDDTQQEQEKEQQQRERQHHDWDPFRLKRIGLSRRQEQQRAAMGPFCETGRDAASGKCTAGCGAVVSWDCRHFCLFCSLRVPLTPASPSPTPSPSPSRSRSRHRSREVFVPRRGLCAGDLQIIDDSQNSPRQRFRSPSLSSRERQPSPRADAASIHRARTWLSSFLGQKPAFIRVRKRARETAGRPAEDTTANVPNWMMRWVRGSVATKWSGHASHASCRAGQADAVRGSEDDRVDAAYADAVRISADAASSRGQQDTTANVPDWMIWYMAIQRVRGTAGVQQRTRRRTYQCDDALGSRKRGHEMVCDMPVMQEDRQMQLAEVHVGCNS